MAKKTPRKTPKKKPSPKRTRRKGKERGPVVCMLSAHPLALEEFERALKESGFRARACIVEPSFAPDLTRLRVPRAAVYLVDAHAPRPTTEALLAALAEHHPDGHVLVVGEDFPQESAFPLLRLGAKGLVRYHDAATQLGRAVASVAGGGFWVPRTLLSLFVDAMLREMRGRRWALASADLSQREQEVLDAVVDNLANKEIAGRLNISERTVKFHVSNLLSKFNVRRRHDLILRCLQTRRGD